MINILNVIYSNMYKLIIDSSIDSYFQNLDSYSDHHICKIKNRDSSLFTIAYRDCRNNKDQLFFDNIAGNVQSEVFISRYDDLDCLRYDDNTIIHF